MASLSTRKQKNAQLLLVILMGLVIAAFFVAF